MENQSLLFAPGTDEYKHGTQPHNSSGSEHPRFVATPRSAAEVSAIVREAAERGLTVVPQATGHGAGGDIGNDTILIDTSRLDGLTIDAERRIARAGAGLTWGTVNPKAEEHGLLGLAGSSPTVSISGYTFGGGVGWLTRPHGMASSALRLVEYVDGNGTIRQASEDAVDPVDRDALWAFRGGGGVGIATVLEFDLVPVPELYAGYLLWTIDALDAVIDAWTAHIADVGDDVTTSISVLHATPSPPFPKELQGKPIVHLAIATSTGPDGASVLLEAVRSARTPVVDTWGPADVARLAGIHLDPPTALPAIGIARWLSGETPSLAKQILAVAAPEDSPLALIELRSVDNHADARDGAETTIPGSYMLHAVGALLDPEARGPIEDSFARLLTVAGPIDVGRSVGSWVEGATSVPDALPDDIRLRVAAIADAVDPNKVIRRSRYLA